MKTLIIAVNAKYIHTSLAPWYLKACCGDAFGEIKVLEFTINENQETLFGAICEEKADVVAFSCYIWNAPIVFMLADSLKKVFPVSKIIFGGPEVSFDSAEIMAANPAVDYIITGEGEKAFPQLMSALIQLREPTTEIEGLFYRQAGEIRENQSALIVEELDGIPSPYTDEMLASVGNRIVYYESSRGCPFSCSYCLSSTTSGVRTFSLERVKKDLTRLSQAGFRQIKFVDRTFNCMKSRVMDIFAWIIALDKQQPLGTNFHFEVAADLFDEEMFHILSHASEGLFQFEIGVQSVNAKTLESIQRKTDLIKIQQHVKRLLDMGNIHLHLDLIAGLPYEDYDSFKNSFNTVYSFKPHQLQLGFLKMLKGSKIRKEAEILGYQYRQYPPYEVLCSRWISFDSLNELKGVEEVFERYYNSGRFSHSLNFIEKIFGLNFFSMYLEIYLYFKKSEYNHKAIPQKELYNLLIQCFESRLSDKNKRILINLLKLDYLSTDPSNNLPGKIPREYIPGFKEQCFDFLKDRTWVSRYLPHYNEFSPKQIYKQVHFEIFDFDVTSREEVGSHSLRKVVILFDYADKHKIIGSFPYYLLDLNP